MQLKAVQSITILFLIICNVPFFKYNGATFRFPPPEPFVPTRFSFPPSPHNFRKKGTLEHYKDFNDLHPTPQEQIGTNHHITLDTTK